MNATNSSDPTRTRRWYRISFLSFLTALVCCGIFLRLNLPHRRTIAEIDTVSHGWPMVYSWSIMNDSIRSWERNHDKAANYWIGGNVFAPADTPLSEIRTFYGERPVENYGSYENNHVLTPDQTFAINLAIEIAITLVLAALVEMINRRFRRHRENLPAGQGLSWRQFSLQSMLVATLVAGVLIGLNATPQRLSVAGVEVTTRGWPWVIHWTADAASVARWRSQTQSGPADFPWTELWNATGTGYPGMSELAVASDLFVIIAGSVMAGVLWEMALRRIEKNKATTAAV